MSSPPRDRDAWGDPSEGDPSDAVSSPRSPTADAAERLVRAASLSPSASRRVSLDAEGDRPRPRDFFERDDDERDDAAKPSESVERGPMGGDAVSTGGRPPRAPGARGVASSGGPKRVPQKNADPGEALSRRETEEEDRPDARRPSRAERATSASRSEDPRTAAFGTAPSATRGSSAADEYVETETRGDDDADPEAADVAEEVDALVSAACARGIGAAAQTLREAMAMASGKNAPGAACCDRHAARAMAEALAAALVKQILPGLAEASRARLLDAETRVRPASLASLASLDAEEDGVDLSAPEATANPRAALLAAQLLDAMPPDDEDEDEDEEAFDRSIETRRRRGPRERVLLALRLAFRARLGNCLEASRAGAFPPLARFLLSAARDAETNQTRRTKLVARLAQTCVARVSAQTVEPAHLRSYLAMARGASGAARGALVAALAEALEHTESLGPAATFQLDGEGSGLLGAAGGATDPADPARERKIRNRTERTERTERLTWRPTPRRAARRSSAGWRRPSRAETRFRIPTRDRALR